jgi:hypothetical protein
MRVPTERVSVAKVSEALQLLNQQGASAIPRLLELYHENVVFQDPIQIVHGREAFARVNERMYARAKKITFLLSHAALAGDDLFLTWEMVFEPKLGPTLRIPGATHLRLSQGLVISHRDYWDLFSSLVETLPVVRAAYRAIVRRLGG